MIVVAKKEAVKNQLKKFEDQISDMSKQDMKELLLINSYKLALVRSQMEALTEIIIRNKLATYEEIWKKTDESFKESSI